jgi:hypothetical protein
MGRNSAAGLPPPVQYRQYRRIDLIASRAPFRPVNSQDLSAVFRTQQYLRLTFRNTPFALNGDLAGGSVGIEGSPQGKLYLIRLGSAFG